MVLVQSLLPCIVLRLIMLLNILSENPYKENFFIFKNSSKISLNINKDKVKDLLDSLY